MAIFDFVSRGKRIELIVYLILFFFSFRNSSPTFGTSLLVDAFHCEKLMEHDMVSHLFLDGQDGLDSGQSVMNPLARSQTTHNYAAYAYLQKNLLNRYIANLDFNI